MNSRGQLLEHLLRESRVLDDPNIRRAFEEIDRADFLGDDYKVEAYEDYALPIGFGQSISQPTTLAFMLEILGAKEGDEVLDVGSGSCWSTALLSKIVGEKGKVIGLEILPELLKLGESNLRKYELGNVELTLAKKGVVGIEGGMFDRILVGAAAQKLPDGLIRELKDGGVLVIPIKESIWRVEKQAGGGILTKEYPGFAFVPLI